MKSLLRIVTASTFALIVGGCGSSVPITDDATDGAVPPQQPTADRQIASRRLEFETRTDTVMTVHRAEQKNAGSQPRTLQIRYMVQIGAFKDPHKATAVQTKARQRYTMPVLNDYFGDRGLYQIRIGFFETRDSARAFRERLFQEYPADYKDSWVVQLRR